MTQSDGPADQPSPLEARQSGPLTGKVRVPGDKSISHRALILGALAADGTSVIHGAHHVQRGYENIDRKFHDLGAQIERLPEPVSNPTP